MALHYIPFKMMIMKCVFEELTVGKFRKNYVLIGPHPMKDEEPPGKQSPDLLQLTILPQAITQSHP